MLDAQLALDRSALNPVGPLAVLRLLRFIAAYLLCFENTVRGADVTFQVDGDEQTCELYVIHPELAAPPTVVLDGLKVVAQQDTQGAWTVQSVDVKCARGGHTVGIRGYGAKGAKLDHVPFVVSGVAGMQRISAPYIPPYFSDREWCLTSLDLHGQRSLRSNVDDLNQVATTLRPIAAATSFWTRGWSFDTKSLWELAKRGGARAGIWEVAVGGAKQALIAVNGKLMEMAKVSCSAAVGSRGE